MEDFYDQFRDNLENRPEPEFREGDWNDLENHLDRQGGKGAAFAWWWLALPVAALLLASNLFFFLQWKNTPSNYSKVEMRSDTVFQTHVVYTTDTIYQTRIIRETKIEYLHSPSFAVQSKYFNTSGTPSAEAGEPVSLLYNDNFKIIPPTNNLATLNTYQQWKKETQRTEAKSEEILAILNKETSYLSSKNIGFLSDPAFPDLELEDIILHRKKRTLNQQLYMMRPKGFSIGFNAGWAKPISEHIESGKGYSAGLHANIKFSEQLRIWLEGSFVRTNYETTKFDPAYGVPDVTTQPPPDFLFEKAEVPQPTLQYAAGLQYLFNTKKKWKPTVGIGFGAVSLLSYELLYEYENVNNDFEWNFDQRVKRNDQLLNFLFIRAGFEFELDNNWDWHVLGTYRTQWDDAKYKTLPTLGIQSGLSYQF